MIIGTYVVLASIVGRHLHHPTSRNSWGCPGTLQVPVAAVGHGDSFQNGIHSFGEISNALSLTIGSISCFPWGLLVHVYVSVLPLSCASRAVGSFVSTGRGSKVRMPRVRALRPSPSPKQLSVSLGLSVHTRPLGAQLAQVAEFVRL